MYPLATEPFAQRPRSDVGVMERATTASEWRKEPPASVTVPADRAFQKLGQEHSTTMIGQQTVKLLVLDPNLPGVYAACSPRSEDPMLELVRIVEHGGEAFQGLWNRLGCTRNY